MTAVNPAAAQSLSLEAGQSRSLAAFGPALQHSPEREILGSLNRAGFWEGEVRLALSETVERRFQARFVRVEGGGAWLAAGVLLEPDAALQDLRTRLEETERYLAVGRMAAGIAHNLNNAMVAVLGYSSMMSGMLRNDPRLSRFTDRIVTASQRAADLIRQFLSFSRTTDLQPVLLSLGDVAEIAAKLYLKSCPAETELDYDIEPNLPLLRGTPFSLHQALQSLMMMIQDGANGKPVRMRLRARRIRDCAGAPGNAAKAGEAIRLEIAGPYPSEALAALRAQWDGAAPPPSAPVSLGLELVRRVVAEHRGWMELGRDNDNVCFVLHFPTRAALEHAGPPAAVESPAGHAHIGVRPAGARLPVILVVDDEQLVLEMAKDLLSEGGYQVLTADRGLGGLEKLATTDGIDMVILDRSMPDLDGVEVYSQLRKTRPKLPVLISTGHNIEESKTAMPPDPFLGFIQKPFCFSDLMNTVRAMLAAS